MRRNVDITKRISGIPTAQVVPASQTTPGQTVTDPFFLHGEGRELLLGIRVTGVTVAAAISANLWTGIMKAADGTVTFRATADKSVSITGNGVFEIRLNPEDASDVTKMPLGPHAKVTIITGAGDAATVQEVRLVERDVPT